MAFEAKYRGHCANDCGNPIEPDDLVFFDADGDLVHDSCRARPLSPICGQCFLTKPCGCDD